ncbi:hypothetical protein GCM10020254_36060 [Streptomyces goshikiensis]
MAVQEMSRGTHTAACLCEVCARVGHRRAVAAFLEKRDEFAAGQGLPAAVAHSLGASRQWVSDELTLSARTVADRGREAGTSWLYLFSRRAVLAVWIAAGTLLVVQVGAALGTGWSTARTAGLLAALVLAGLLTVAARAQSLCGGLLAPIVGEDNRLSTSKAVPSAWLVLTAFAALLPALRLAASSPGPERQALYQGFALGRALPLLAVVALTSGVAVLVRRVVCVRIMSQKLQKLPADRPCGADLLTDDAGRGSFPDAQYVLVSTVVVVYAGGCRWPGSRTGCRSCRGRWRCWSRCRPRCTWRPSTRRAAARSCCRWCADGSPGTWTRPSGPGTTSRSGASGSCRPGRRRRRCWPGWWSGSGRSTSTCHWFRWRAGSPTPPTRC